MRSNNNKRAVVVGVFVFLGIAIFIITVLTLGGQQKTFAKSINIKAVFDDVQGLAKGNNVWFSGVKIGTVKKISFYGKSQVEVDMNIEEKAQEYIRKNAKAKISSEGFIGNKIVVIEGGTDQSPTVENGDLIGVEKALGTDEIMSTLQQNNRNLLDITSDFKVVSKRLSAGQGTVGKLLADETVANNLEKVINSLQRASANAQRLTETVQQYASQLNNKGSLANELVTDTVVYARLKAASQQINDLSNTATSVVNDLKTATGNINNGLNNKNAPLGMLLHDENSASSIKSTLKNLNAGSQKLNDDLEAVQHNFLLRGFFRKKAKNEAKGDTTNQ